MLRAANSPKCISRLGLAELGPILSCNRDGSMIEGFNPEIEFARTQTLMEGARHCDFRYRTREALPRTDELKMK